MDDVTRQWLEPLWCDFRLQTWSCTDSTLWTTVFIIHSIWAFLLFLMGLWIVVKKIGQLREKGLGIFEVCDGAVRPRAAEALLVTAAAHILGRGAHTTVVLAGGFGSWAVGEILFDIPWVILFDGAVFYVIGIIYGTPRHRLVGSSTQSERLPSPRILNLLLFLLTLLPSTTLPLTAYLSGWGRDTAQVHWAVTFTQIHYVLWGVYCIALSGLLLHFGLKLIGILRENSGTMKVLTEQVELSHTNLEGSAGEEFRRTLITLIITVGCMITMVMGSSIVLLAYAFRRIEIHNSFPLSLLIGFTWMFMMPLCLTPIFIVTIYGMLRTKKEIKAHQDSIEKSGSRSNPGQRADARRASVRPGAEARRASMKPKFVDTARTDFDEVL
ncbi:uncharacterized protein EV422DRAFT_565694 [Fimicolochytrium jonesii]|uniref:uncharacterized protein n=1 Tax=Fimicolochytrium jonesii TaxID=1396493 RepID=UPI0022FE3080|nr:uncharacterized protein EV422DRAFT_565694 [Fimicolochytrium jonesii]KAI8823780.1 hypothetical protein EV422DRAFT_565694 [Fimicolochytrium jonesii]